MNAIIDKENKSYKDVIEFFKRGKYMSTSSCDYEFFALADNTLKNFVCGKRLYHLFCIEDLRSSTYIPTEYQNYIIQVLPILKEEKRKYILPNGYIVNKNTLKVSSDKSFYHSYHEALIALFEASKRDILNKTFLIDDIELYRKLIKEFINSRVSKAIEFIAQSLSLYEFYDVIDVNRRKVSKLVDYYYIQPEKEIKRLYINLNSKKLDL